MTMQLFFVFVSGWEKRHVLWFGTLDGALGYLLPCSEKTYRRLLMLQNVLVTAIPHAAGLTSPGNHILYLILTATLKVKNLRENSSLVRGVSGRLGKNDTNNKTL